MSIFNMNVWDLGLENGNCKGQINENEKNSKVNWEWKKGKRKKYKGKNEEKIN